jgi:hypothetical protein
VVTLRGGVTGGTNQILTLPAAMRPANNVWVPTTLCNGDYGRIVIGTNGGVSVESAGGVQESDATCFTSLDGVSFVVSPIGSTPLSLINGWTGGAFGTGAGAVEDALGYVHLSGAISSGSNLFPFVLPPNFRPAQKVYVAADMCDASVGRLDIFPNGAVELQESDNGSSNAACFTSLDGVSFEADAYTKLSLLNGWAPFNQNGTSVPAVSVVNGIVTLAGAISTPAANTNPVMFTLPPGFRPTTDVYVAVSLCNGRDGRLYIQPSGVVQVQAEGTFGDAQCFTSLDGAAFSIMPATFHALTLQNGWINAPLSTNSAAVANVNGVVTFKGAVNGGTADTLFTLPAAYRPSVDVFVKIGLCNATEGRLDIYPSGVVNVETPAPFSEAQCFISLDGASFVLNPSLQTALTLENGWTGGPFSTAAPAVEDLAGQVHLSGAMATTGTDEYAFVLPAQFAPGSTVFLPLDLCDGNTGELVVFPNGQAVVNDLDPTYAQAQCFTSLDGVTFAR